MTRLTPKGMPEPDPAATPVYECPECFRAHPSRDDVCKHLIHRCQVNRFPEWKARKLADAALRKMPHEVAGEVSS